MDALQMYLRVFTRPSPTFEVPIGAESAPNFFVDTAKWAVFFCFAMAAVPMVARAWYPKWYANLEVTKRGQFPPYLISMAHHCVVVPVGWYYLIADLHLEDYTNGMLDYSTFLELLPAFLAAFVVADTLYFAIPEAVFNGNQEYLAHHILALFLFVPFLYGPGALVRFYPHLIVCETTNFFFNTAWLLRVAGYRDSPIVSFCEVSFAVLFFVLRFVNLTLVFYRIFFSDEGIAMGPFRWLFPPIAALQWYWMYCVIRALAKKMSPSASKKKIT